MCQNLAVGVAARAHVINCLAIVPTTIVGTIAGTVRLLKSWAMALDADVLLVSAALSSALSTDFVDGIAVVGLLMLLFFFVH